MNKIVLNGKKSSEIVGMLIQELPAITKPARRVEQETIDGRDGDTSRFLGYQSYDKTMEIGLYGNFDIDEVIKYFDSSGEVVFSNEPDKKYRYEIVEQIDFERLLRFRTATVTFHVQPFKYSAVEEVYSFRINEKIRLPQFTERHLDGEYLTIETASNAIKINGTADGSLVRVPIRPLVVDAGEYEISITTKGVCNGLWELVGEISTGTRPFDPTNVQVFEVDEPTQFDYIEVYLPKSGSIAFEVYFTLTQKSANITNSGNIFSKPTYNLTGSGNVQFSTEGGILAASLAQAEELTVDVETLNAYNGNTLMNRSCYGDYSKLTLREGVNKVSWSGDITRFEVVNYSRWI